MGSDVLLNSISYFDAVYMIVWYLNVSIFCLYYFMLFGKLFKCKAQCQPWDLVILPASIYLKPNSNFTYKPE